MRNSAIIIEIESINIEAIVIPTVKPGPNPVIEPRRKTVAKQITAETITPPFILPTIAPPKKNANMAKVNPKIKWNPKAKNILAGNIAKLRTNDHPLFSSFTMNNINSR